MLKYLFIAEFADGSTLRQDQEDRSAIDPAKRSQFYDVLNCGKELVRFDLLEQSSTPDHKLQGGDKYSVRLTDGSFSVNDGPWFRMHEEDLSGFQLIFFRQHTHSFNQSIAGGDVSTKEIAHEIVYRIGWQCNWMGKNHQRVMEIK